jgi:tetratricopeptide (TPR) repeat protein
MRKFVFSTFLFVSFSMASPVFAQDDAPSSADIKRAATAYDQGRERFREGQYTEAAEKFESADDYAPSAAALRLAIFARKEAGQLARALTHAALALELYPDNSELRGEAQAVIDEVGGDFGKVRVTCDEPCELLLNNRIVHGEAATSRLLYVEPGSANVRASWSEGRNESESISVRAGSEKKIEFYSPEIPVVPTNEPKSQKIGASTSSDPAVEDAKKGGWHPAVFLTGLGLTVAGAGATVGLGINAKKNPGAEAVRTECEQGNKECETYKEGVRNQTYANVALGATAAFGVFTIASAFLTDWGGKDEDAVSYRQGDLSIRPTFAVGDGALLGATGTF